MAEGRPESDDFAPDQLSMEEANSLAASLKLMKALVRTAAPSSQVPSDIAATLVLAGEVSRLRYAIERLSDRPSQVVCEIVRDLRAEP